MIAAPIAAVRRAAGASLSLTLALTALTTAARADTVVLFATADNTLYETPAGDLSNGAGPVMFAGRTNDLSNTHRRALVRFTIGGIPAGSTVTSATLQLYCAISTSNGPTFLYNAVASWGEGPSNAGYPGDAGAPAQGNDATWTDRFYIFGMPWTSAGGDIGIQDGAVVTTSIGNVTFGGFGLASRVQSWLNNPASNFGWFLMGDESHTGTVNGFSTREGTTVATLTVQYIPPATPVHAATWGSLKAVYH